MLVSLWSRGLALVNIISASHPVVTMFLDGRYQKQPCPNDKRNKSNVAYLSVNPIAQRFIANIQLKKRLTCSLKFTTFFLCKN